MKKTLIFSLLIFLFTNTYSQKLESVKINVLKEEILVDKVIIKKTTTIDEVTKTLGKPERIEQFAGKDKTFIYDSKGLSFSINSKTPKMVIESVTITFTHDGDKKVANEKFTGTLLVDNYAVTEKSTAQNIQEKTDIKKMECYGLMCVSDPKDKGVIAMMGLTEAGDIMQIVFGFKP